MAGTCDGVPSTAALVSLNLVRIYLYCKFGNFRGVFIFAKFAYAKHRENIILVKLRNHSFVY